MQSIPIKRPQNWADTKPQLHQFTFITYACKSYRKTHTCCLSPNTVSAFCLWALASSLSPPQTRWVSSPLRYTEGLGPPLPATALPCCSVKLMHCPFMATFPGRAGPLWPVRASRSRAVSSSKRLTFSRSSSASLLRLWSSFSQTSSSSDRVRRAVWASWDRIWLACSSERASLSWAFKTTMSPAFWLSSDWISLSCCFRREISPDFWHTWWTTERKWERGKPQFLPSLQVRFRILCFY